MAQGPWRSPIGQVLPINSVEIIVRCTPNDLPDSAETGHSPSVPIAEGLRVLRLDWSFSL